MIVLKIFGMIMVGIVFGFCMQKSQVQKPEILREQFILQNWIVMKLFLAAVASSAIIQSLINLIDPVFQESTRPCKPKKFVYTRVATGAAILGAGMALAGSCPGQVYALMGAMSLEFVPIILGMLFGSIVFFIIDEKLQLFELCEDKLVEGDQIKVEEQNNVKTEASDNGNQQSNRDIKDFDKKINKTNNTHESLNQGVELKEGKKGEFIDTALGLHYSVVSFGIGLMLIGMIAVLELIFPWKGDLLDESQHWDDTIWNPFMQKAWPPWVSGGLTGLMQLPARYLNGNGLGSSGATYGLVSTLFDLVGFNGVSAFRNSEMALLIFCKMLVGVCLGSMASAQLGGDLAKLDMSQMQDVRAFVGGFLLLFGSRMGGGCTSGHGFTGFSNLNLKSAVGCCAIFGSAIVVAVAQKLLV